MIDDNINQFTYRDKKSFSDAGLIMYLPPKIIAPKREISFVTIPGRSGDIIYSQKKFTNTQITYHAEIFKENFDISAVARKVRAWLQTEIGYFNLSDTYNPDYFYRAAFEGGIDIEQEFLHTGKSPLAFNCKPFKYSLIGQSPIIFTGAKTLANPEAWETKPYIKITGSGNITLKINNASFTFKGIKDYIEVDSEMMSAYKATELQNDKAYFDEFPILSPGTNNISFTGSVSQIEIIPRWCCL